MPKLDAKRQALNAKRRPACRQAGFTLIEIAFASMFVIAIVAIFLAGSGSFIHNRGSYLQSVATQISSCEIEQLRKIPFTSIINSLIPRSILSPCSDDLPKLPTGSATETITDYQSDPNIKKVVITVTWKLNNVNKNLNVETLISKYGL